MHTIKARRSVFFTNGKMHPFLGCIGPFIPFQSTVSYRKIPNVCGKKNYAHKPTLTITF